MHLCTVHDTPGHDVTTVASLQCLCDGAELLRMAGGRRKRSKLVERGTPEGKIVRNVSEKQNEVVS